VAILVLGSINVDLVVCSERLPRPGETVLGGEFFTAGGGKGANQAVAAARASRGKVRLIAAVGDDAHGKEALENLRRAGVATDCVKIVAGESTGVALIMVDRRGENSISVASGANRLLSPADVDAIPRLAFDDARVLLTCLESPIETVARGLTRAKAAGMLTILNPAPVIDRAAVIELLPAVDVLTPNEGEAATLAGVPTGANARDAAAALVRLGCRRLVMTLGPRGCLVVEDQTVTEIPGNAVVAVDATGAGDAFNGALAVALAEGHSLVDAARWANRAAALAVQHRGAQPSLPTRSQIDAFDPGVRP
jgi:ribokinase